MNIAFDASPLSNANKNRGVGKYTEMLLSGLRKLSEVNVREFRNGQPIPPCDLVHYPYFDPFFLTLPLFKKYPTVVTIHDLIPLHFPKEFPRGVKGDLKWQIQKQSLKSVKVIITDSECSKRDIIKFTKISPQKIHVVYLAPLFSEINISENEIRNFKQKYSLPDKFLLYIGDINYHKNIPNLYRALGLLKEKIKIVLVGNSFLNNSLPEKKQLDKLATDLKIENKLLKLGALTDKEIKILYLLVSAYIQPSLYEGFGLPVVEAMSSGCPVVCSDRGSLPEVAGDAVIYINPDNPQSIAFGIEKILCLDEKSRQDIIEKGKTQSSKFSWTKTVQQTVEIYKKYI